MDDTKTSYCLTGTFSGSLLRAVVPPSGLEVGRSHTCGLAVPDPEVSRQHCIVRVADGKVTVENLSQNGTLVNGTKAEGVTEIKVGDVLGLGTSELKLETCGTPAPEIGTAETFKPGDMVDRYRITRLIGKGGMGTVYEVMHTGLDLPRALKALTLPDDPSYAAFREKFLDEGKMLARLKHDNITQVYDAAYDEKTRTLFFVMDLVLYDDGKPCTLADVAYDECDVSAWFASLASALDYVHRQGIVHSDIKLQNVLVSAGQKIKLADFGVAHLLSGKMRASLHGGETSDGKETIGYTAHYVAPEILKDDAMPSAASDVYALGIMLVRLLAGKWYDECPSVLAEIAAKRSLNWRPILTQMLCADPQRRVTDLSKLVNELRHGSKAPARRKFQMESRRRRSQKIRLQRIPNRKTEGLVSTPFAPEPKWKKILRWSALAACGLAVVVGLVWMQTVNSRNEEIERKRVETLQHARQSANDAYAKAHDAFSARVGAIKPGIDRHRQDYDFVGELVRANVTGSTDRVVAARRNEIIVRYGDVLKAIAEVRASATDFKPDFNGFNEYLGELADADALSGTSEAAISDRVEQFKTTVAQREGTLEAALAGEGQKWTAYLAAREALDAVCRSRRDLFATRNGRLEDIRRAIEAEPVLKTEPEIALAKRKFEEGDELIEDRPDELAAADRLYSEAVAALTNGSERLRLEREERAAIEKMFHRSDENLRKKELDKLRHGDCSLTALAVYAKDESSQFQTKWESECRFACHTGLVADCSFELQAHASYLGYLATVLHFRQDGMTFALSEKGVTVTTKRFPLEFSWNAIFSKRRQDTKQKERCKRMILELCNIPPETRCSPKLLLGRWILLNELMPDLNDEEQEKRLVEAIGASADERVLACARHVLPEKFPAAEAPKPTAPAIEFADFPSELPAQKVDPTHERVVFFAPAAGLSLPVFGGEDVGVTKCARVRGTRRVQFQLMNGMASSGNLGARHPEVDVEEGGSFDACFESAPGIFRFWLVTWIDGAWADGKSLVVIRCQKVSDTSSVD